MHWTLREEILNLTHRWPLIAAFFLAGSLLGWATSFIWPSQYRATKEIYIGLDPYRTIDDRYVADYVKVEFRNPDDYKHWQMSQISALVTSDSYLQDTISRLRGVDPFWDDIKVPALREMLKAYWRNAGQWRLVAENSDSQLAEQAVKTWEEVIFEKLNLSIVTSRSLAIIESDLEAVARGKLDAQLQESELIGIRAALHNEKEILLSNKLRQPLESLERWRLWSLAARAADFDQAWQQLLSEFPMPLAYPQEYVMWIDRLVANVEQKIDLSQVELEVLDQKQKEITAQWNNLLPGGQGLSAALIIESLSNTPVVVERLRPTTEMALIGGALGFLAWALMTLVQVSKMRDR